MSEAAVTFRIFGQSCVVILPPSLDVAPANDVDRANGSGIGIAQRAQPSQSSEERVKPGFHDASVAGEAPDGAFDATAGQPAPAVPASRPSEIVLRGAQD